MEGTAEITIRGSAQDFTYGVYRQSADKYAEIMSSPATGEVREVYNGKTHFSQADYGLFERASRHGRYVGGRYFGTYQNADEARHVCVNEVSRHVRPRGTEGPAS